MQTSDGDTSYSREATANGNNDSTTANPTLSGATSVNSVSTLSESRDEGSGGQHRDLLYMSEATARVRYAGTASTPGSSYGNAETIRATNPSTASTWTINEVTGAAADNFYFGQIGVRATSLGIIRTTYIRLLADFNTAAGLSVPVAMHHYTKNIGSRC